MKINRPETYYEAALERIGEAGFLRRQQRYVLAMYASGLAAECMLRAYWPADHVFDPRHDLVQVLKGCAIELGDAARRKLHDAVQTIHELWHNNYRFADEARVRAHLRQLQLHRRGIARGADFLKVRCAELWDAGSNVIEVGRAKWPERR